MVPPVNARRRGVQQWSPERRRLNANYLDDPDPLIAVMTRVNRDDPILGNSALDRLANASYQIVTEGTSYRERLSPHRALLGAHGGG